MFAAFYLLYYKLQVLTSEGWGLFLLLPEALPVRIGSPFVFTLLSLKSVWYVDKFLFPLLGKIFEVFGLCMKRMMCMNYVSRIQMRGSHTVAKRDGQHTNSRFTLPRISRRRPKRSPKFPFICGHVEQLWVFCVAVFDAVGKTGTRRRHASRSCWSSCARCYVRRNNNNKLVY